MTKPSGQSLANLFALGVLLAGCRPDAPLSPPDAPGLLLRVGSSFDLADATGTISTFSTTGSINTGGPFFQSLGTNGRNCATCHLQGDAWGLSAASARAVFAARGPGDPLFAPVDGANCPDVTAADGPAGHSLLLDHGLIRIGMTVPADAEFTVAVAHDPYGCASKGAPGSQELSMYRRVLPSTNLPFLSAVMFDGRETVNPLTNGGSFLANLRANLSHQAMDATLGHAQAARAPTANQVNGIVDFELAMFTAQGSDNVAGVLNAQGARGGSAKLAGESYYPGINDPLGDNPTGAAFNDTAMTMYASWETLNSGNPFTAARAAVARGEAVFNTQPLSIVNVAGLNDALGQAVIRGTCTTCHDTPNVGDHSRPVPLDIGIGHVAGYETDPQVTGALGQVAMPDLPVFRMTCTRGPLAGTITYTSDPGRALVSGFCRDIGKMKGPILRGLSARGPYFHNGAAETLGQVVGFYDQRFQMGLSSQQKADLIAFLQTL